MTAAFDARTGRLRLDQETFDCLVAWANGRTQAGPELSDLRAAGAIEHGLPHPAVRPGLQAVTEPVCRLQIGSMDDQGGRRAGEGWVSGDAAALLLDVTDDGMRELVTVHPAFLPMAIARVVRLGPHPRPGEDPLHLPRAIYDGVFAVDRAERRRAADRVHGDAPDPPLRDVVESLVTGPWRLWAVTLTWTTPQGEPAARALQVLDTEAGLCLVDTGGRDATLWPTSATGIWRRLTLLLPDEVQTR